MRWLQWRPGSPFASPKAPALLACPRRPHLRGGPRDPAPRRRQRPGRRLVRRSPAPGPRPPARRRAAARGRGPPGRRGDRAVGRLRAVGPRHHQRPGRRRAAVRAAPQRLPPRRRLLGVGSGRRGQRRLGCRRLRPVGRRGGRAHRRPGPLPPGGLGDGLGHRLRGLGRRRRRVRRRGPGRRGGARPRAGGPTGPRPAALRGGPGRAAADQHPAERHLDPAVRCRGAGRGRAQRLGPRGEAGDHPPAVLPHPLDARHHHRPRLRWRARDPADQWRLADEGPDPQAVDGRAGDRGLAGLGDRDLVRLRRLPGQVAAGRQHRHVPARVPAQHPAARVLGDLRHGVEGPHRLDHPLPGDRGGLHRPALPAPAGRRPAGPQGHDDHAAARLRRGAGRRRARSGHQRDRAQRLHAPGLEPMTAMDETMLRAPRGRAGRITVGRRDRQAAGRHERRVQLVEAVEQPVQATRATRATRAAQVRATRSARSRHAARAGWVERARRLAAQARAWWAEGTERVAGGRRGRAGNSAPTAGRTHLAPAGTSAPHRPVNSPRRVTEPAPRHLSAVGRRASWGEDVVTGWCLLLLVLGLCLDGTAWRGVLYLGFAGTAGWILTREQRPGTWSPRAVPPGYRVGLVGVGLAMVAVAGDAAWHALAGAAEPGQQALVRLVSPFHLVLLGGAGLLAGSVLRAAWSGPSPARVAGLKAFWPVVLAVSLVAAMTAFFFQDVSPVAAPVAGTAPVGELAGLLLHNLLFIAPVLLLLLRWQTPLGTFTVMAGSVAVALAILTGPGLVGLAGAAVLGGAAADVAVALLRPSPQRRWAARAVAVIAPAVYWTAHVALLGVGYGAGWEPALWLGSVLWACLSGFALAWLMWPPAVPLTAWNRGRARTPSTTTPTAMPARMVGR